MAESRGGPWHNAPLNTLLPRSLRLGTCERISSFKKRLIRLDLARGKLELSISLQETFTEIKCMMDTHDVCCNNMGEDPQTLV